MKKSMNLGWSCGRSDVLLSLATGAVYHYEKDYESLHHQYGGKCYYKSWSGMSGNGTIPDVSDLVKIQQVFPSSKEIVPEFPPIRVIGNEGKELHIFQVAKSHQNTKDYALCLIGRKTVPEKIVLCSESDVIRYVKNFENIEEDEFKEVQHHEVVPTPEQEEGSFYYGHAKTRVFIAYKGIWMPRISQFLRNAGIVLDQPSLAHKKMGIGFYDTRLYAYGPDGTLAKNVIEEDLEAGTSFRGVHHDTEGNYWLRQDDTTILCWVQIETSPGMWMEYEEEFRPYDFFINKEGIFAHLRERLEVKISLQKNSADDIPAIMYWLTNVHEEFCFTIEDSLRVGNCRPGTESFMKAFNLEDQVTANSLAAHKHIGLMLKNAQFRQMIWSKMHPELYVKSIDNTQIEEEYLPEIKEEDFIS